VRVVVVDDNACFRAAAREVVEATRGFVVLSILPAADEVVRRVRACRADLVLMDVRMPGTGGVAAARTLAGLARPPVVFLMSADECPAIAADPGAHGAVAFVPKQAFGPGLLRSLWGRFAPGMPVPA
jgi:DNA-binding NarL/FixJ family response regulator